MTVPGPERSPAPSTRALPPIRPVTIVHVRGAAVDASADSVVPVRQVLVNPPWPVPWAVLTAALLGLVAVLALAGVGTAAGRPAKGALEVAGQDASTLPVVDLSEVFVLRAGRLPAARGANEVLLDLSIAGVPLVASSVGKPAADGSVSVDARGSRYLATGTVEATATFRRNGTDLTTVTFPLRTKRSAFTSVPGIAAVLALLFLLAYAESQLAPLRRRGRRRLSSLVGLAFAGAVLGALAAVFVWLTGTDELLTSALGVCAAAGAAAGVTLGITTYQAGRRARLRRIAGKRSPTAG